MQTQWIYCLLNTANAEGDRECHANERHCYVGQTQTLTLNLRKMKELEQHQTGVCVCADAISANNVQTYSETWGCWYQILPVHGVIFWVQRLSGINIVTSYLMAFEKETIAVQIIVLLETCLMCIDKSHWIAHNVHIMIISLYDELLRSGQVGIMLWEQQLSVLSMMVNATIYRTMHLKSFCFVFPWGPLTWHIWILQFNQL